MRILLLCLLAIALSGCLGGGSGDLDAAGTDDPAGNEAPGDPGDGEDDAAAPDPGPVTQVRTGAQDLVIGGFRVGSFAGAHENCLVFPTTFMPLTINATATWNADTPLAEAMEVIFATESQVVARSAGSSPQELELVGFPTGGLMILVQVADPGFAYDQSVQLDYEVTHLETGPIEIGLDSCVFE